MLDGFGLPTFRQKPGDVHLTTATLRAVIDKGCRVMPPVGEEARAAKLDALIEARAWSDAALALLQVEAPGWCLRRLELDADAGEWHCSLSRHPLMPAEFDDAAEGRHHLLPLAILEAAANARLHGGLDRSPANVVPNGRNSFGDAACCENFR